MSHELQLNYAAPKPTGRWRRSILKWSFLHSIVVGGLLGAAMTMGYRFAYDGTNGAILHIPIAGDFFAAQPDSVDRFRLDLRHYFHGTDMAPYSDGVSIVKPDLFQDRKSPPYALIEVKYGARPLLGGLVHAPIGIYSSRIKWAVSMSGGPNACFDEARLDYRRIAGFLGVNSVKISNQQDAERVRKIVNSLFREDRLDPVSYKQISTPRWTIGKLRSELRNEVFEVFVSKDDIIQTGAVREVTEAD